MKTSPDGMFRLPSELIQRRPSTEISRSVPSPSIRSTLTPERNSTIPCCCAPQFLPGPDRIFLVQKHRAFHISFVVGQVHLRLTGVAGRGILGQYPALL